MNERGKGVWSKGLRQGIGISGNEEIRFCAKCSMPLDHRFSNLVQCLKCIDSRVNEKLAKEEEEEQFPFPEQDLKTGKGKIVVPSEKKAETQLQEQQKTTVRRGIKPRTSYVSPSREGKVTITTHVDPELKEAVTKLADQSNLTFNEFITAILKREVASPAQQTDETLHLSEEALEKTREAEKVLHRLTVNLSNHSR